MSPAAAVQFLNESMLLVMVVSLPPIAVASVVGLFVSLIQALTQVQEQTLSFAIKLVAVAIAIAALSGWLGQEVLNFTVKIFDSVPKLT